MVGRLLCLLLLCTPATAIVQELAAPEPPPPREIDVRVLQDEDRPLQELAPEPGYQADAFDLQFLDVREGVRAELGPGLFVRVGFLPGSGWLNVTFRAGATEHAWSMHSSDGTTFTHDGPATVRFEDIDGPSQILEMFAPYETIGAGPGRLTWAWSVTSSTDRPGDIMPGSYYLAPGLVAPQTETMLERNYALRGPLETFRLDAAGYVDWWRTGSVELGLRSALGTMPQDVTLLLDPPDIVQPASFTIDPTQHRALTMYLGPAPETLPETLRIEAWSSLGATHNVTLPVLQTLPGGALGPVVALPPASAWTYGVEEGPLTLAYGGGAVTFQVAPPDGVDEPLTLWWFEGADGLARYAERSGLDADDTLRLANLAPYPVEVTQEVEPEPVVSRPWWLLAMPLAALVGWAARWRPKA